MGKTIDNKGNGGIKMKLEYLSAIDVMELMDKLEAVEPKRFLGTEEQTVDSIFISAFGIDYEEEEMFAELRSLSNQMFMLTEDIFTKDYYRLMAI